MRPIDSARRQAAIDEIRSTGSFRSVQWLEAIDSTNRYLADGIRQMQLDSPALVVADLQTAGVGRGSNQWWSPSGCLMFSMAIPLASPLGHEHTMLPLQVGLAIAQSLEPIASVRPMVKWPNDVYLGGKKVCGVLIECVALPRDASTSTPQPQWVAIIGVGINCQVPLESAPESIRSRGTSLHQWIRGDRTEQTTTESVLVNFVHEWHDLHNKQIDAPKWIAQVWPDRSLLHDNWVQIKHPGGIASGRCIGIDERGALLVQNEQLQTSSILAGEVLSFQARDPDGLD